ncbi:solute carrier family 2, facilitated glucose transporter member 12 [Protopterus annectens]|uniref:solute carrier family 2, facilitated glucose transporter member 12 n=1 Tax=Protopterus annectens TaxID=7888 RepID=UPI001CFBE5C9|nr:solute carrier family 2, facilitated glucose transporter member 12 [Protopterus annectens]
MESVKSDNTPVSLLQLPATAGSTTFTVFSSSVAAVSGLLLGYELCIISGTLLQLHSLLGLTCQQQELVVSALLFGAVASSVVGGFILDRYGRRITIIVTSCLLVLGSLALIFSVSYVILIVGRIIIGTSVSMSAVATCVYIAEIAPAQRRGFLVSLNELMIVVGILSAYISNCIFATVTKGWQIMFGLVIPPATLQAVVMYCLPPSPRFLIKSGHSEAAADVLEKLRAKVDIYDELDYIRASLKEEGQYSFCDLFRSKDNMRARMLVGIFLALFVQITGQPTILFYASTIFKSVGFHSNVAATLASVGIGVVKVMATIPATLLVDRVGSKTFLCIGSLMMSLSLTAMALVSFQIPINFGSICGSHGLTNHSWVNSVIHLTNNTHMNHDSKMSNFSKQASNFTSQILFASLATTAGKKINSSWNMSAFVTLEERTTVLGKTAHTVVLEMNYVPSVFKWLSLASLLIYVAAFSIGLGPMVWLVLSEIFPAGIRGRAMAITSSVNWGANLLISLTFLTVIETVGLPKVLFIYAFLCLMSAIFTIMFVPNTKGQSLEQISKQLSDRSYMKKAICCAVTIPKTHAPSELLNNKQGSQLL